MLEYEYSSSIAFTNVKCYSDSQNYIDFSRFGSRSPLHFRAASLDRFMNIRVSFGSVNSFGKVFLTSCSSPYADGGVDLIGTALGDLVLRISRNIFLKPTLGNLFVISIRC